MSVLGGTSSLPDDQVTAETVEQLEVRQLQTFAEERSNLRWYKRPSPWWVLIAIAASALSAAIWEISVMQIWTQVVCEHRGSTDGESPLSRLLEDNGEQLPCAADPEIIAAVTKLDIIYTLFRGVLGCLTTGWWTSLSDRIGRTRVLTIGVLGFLYVDLNAFIVAKAHNHLPGGYWWFVFGGLVEGLTGGIFTINATIYAYVADTVEPHRHAQIFSVFYGVLLAGFFTFRPIVSNIILGSAGGPLSGLYIAMVINSLYALLVWFALPESLTRAQRDHSRRLYQERVEKGTREAVHSPVLHWFKQIPCFSNPLSVLWTKRGDRSLLFMALSYGSLVLFVASTSYKFEYSSAVVGWTSEQIGYWMSTVEYTRAGFLVVLLPLLIKLFKPASQLPVTSDATETTPLRQGQKTPSSLYQSIAFDLTVVRVSIIIEFLSMIAIPFTSNTLLFVAFAILGTFGSGHTPASQSVSLALYTQSGGTESGRLFGALAALQIFNYDLLAPALLSLTLVTTIPTAPTVIFLVASALVALSFIFTLYIHLPKSVQNA
ncbi:hypothetical protein BXZ70DRAFT_1067453 [Cristinia sonorae]|uniref:MFS general substrate transporter n=1 Tax=Cristinia sonorae TaxID=1940300 RepID=A0A8K0UHP5_9AGAR|nr:hypothetical protein BXZ70DRAFT_1067453 [Cristinia sonorae]